MDAILISLNIIMALVIWWKRGCKWFAMIQTLQLLEIPFMYEFGMWMSLDQFNILVECFAILSTRRLKWARVLMFIHASAKIYRYASIDCDYQLTTGPLYIFIYWLNNLVLFTLLAYAFSKPILRLKEYYVKRLQEAAYSPA